MEIPREYVLGVLFALIGALFGRVALRGPAPVVVAALPLTLLVTFVVSVNSGPIPLPGEPSRTGGPVEQPSETSDPGTHLVSDLDEEGCPVDQGPVTWLTSEAPKGVASLVIEQPACTTLLVTSGTIRAESGWTCGNAARQQCAYMNRTGPLARRVELTVDVDNVWQGVSDAGPERTIADKSRAMLAPPNCGGGCGWATVGSHENGVFGSELRIGADLTVSGTTTTLFVDARDQEGSAAFVAPKTGNYDFRITCGSYKTVPSDGPEGFYRSVVFGYIGAAPSVRWTTRWGHPEPGLADLELGVWETQAVRSRSAVETASLGLSTTKFMTTGERAIFTAVDERGWPYADNRGGICLAITYAGSG